LGGRGGLLTLLGLRRLAGLAVGLVGALGLRCVALSAVGALALVGAGRGERPGGDEGKAGGGGGGASERLPGQHGLPSIPLARDRIADQNPVYVDDSLAVINVPTNGLSTEGVTAE